MEAFEFRGGLRRWMEGVRRVKNFTIRGNYEYKFSKSDGFFFFGMTQSCPWTQIHQDKKGVLSPFPPTGRGAAV